MLRKFFKAPNPRQLAVQLTRGYLILLIVMYFGQDRIILRPTQQFTYPLSAEMRISDWTPHGDFEGLVVEPADKPALATVVFFHGNGGSVEGRLSYATKMAHAGYRSVFLEYPGFGRRAGSLTVAAAKASAFETFSLVRTKWSGPVIISGESFGAGLAAQVAGQNAHAVAKVVLITPWDSLEALVHEKLPFLPTSLLLHDSLDSVKAMRTSGLSVFVLAAAHDRLIPPAHAKALADALPRSEFKLLPYAEHNTWPTYVTVSAWAEMFRF
jgi:pimeloyl-ACP methyl ester carboxylesterase